MQGSSHKHWPCWPCWPCWPVTHCYCCPWGIGAPSIEPNCTLTRAEHPGSPGPSLFVPSHLPCFASFPMCLHTLHRHDLCAGQIIGGSHVQRAIQTVLLWLTVSWRSRISEARPWAVMLILTMIPSGLALIDQPRGHLTSSLKFIPSGKRLHNYGKIHRFSWEISLEKWWF